MRGADDDDDDNNTRQQTWEGRFEDPSPELQKKKRMRDVSGMRAKKPISPNATVDEHIAYQKDILRDLDLEIKDLESRINVEAATLKALNDSLVLLKEKRETETLALEMFESRKRGEDYNNRVTQEKFHAFVNFCFHLVEEWNDEPEITPWTNLDGRVLGGTSSYAKLEWEFPKEFWAMFGDDTENFVNLFNVGTDFRSQALLHFLDESKLDSYASLPRTYERERRMALERHRLRLLALGDPRPNAKMRSLMRELGVKIHIKAVIGDHGVFLNLFEKIPTRLHDWPIHEKLQITWPDDASD